jgi:flagellar hook-basal body complex protein FliE
MSSIIPPSTTADSSLPSGIEKRPAKMESGLAFGNILKDSIGEVNTLQHEASQAVEALTAGRSSDVHNTMIALQKADISFRLLMQIRNKVVSAYETVMRMQI